MVETVPTISATSVPVTLRCVVIACFLAAHNPKESDNLKFVGEKSRKRKQPSESTGGNQIETFVPNAQSNSSSSKGSSPDKYFHLERLLSVYSHVVQICNSSFHEAGFGQPSLQSMISSLCEKRLLTRWSPSHRRKPQFASHIPRDLAEALAASLKFPLRDFLTNSYRQKI